MCYWYFSLFLLFIVLIPGIGVEVNGARRWIDFDCVYRSQKLVKLAVVRLVSLFGSES